MSLAAENQRVPVRSAHAPRIAVLVSGEGSNLQALIDTSRVGALGGEIAVVVSNRGQARGLERARAAGIAAEYLPAVRGAERSVYDAALAALLAGYRPDLLVLAGFMRIFTDEFVARFAGRMLNIHPSLLPRYPGLDTHRRVIEAGDPVHGATVHFVTADLDAGPTVIQYRLPVRSNDTPETLAARVHRGEHIILPRAVLWFTSGRLRQDGGDVMLDRRRLDAPAVVEEEA